MGSPGAAADLKAEMAEAAGAGGRGPGRKGGRAGAAASNGQEQSSSEAAAPSAKRTAAPKKGAGGKGFMQCRGCRKNFPVEVFGCNNLFCMQDKRALDRIAILAKAQGQKAVEFYSESRSDPNKPTFACLGNPEFDPGTTVTIPKCWSG
eukprot:9994081-Alexandrium_andersonii.AAC.1